MTGTVDMGVCFFVHLRQSPAREIHEFFLFVVFQKHITYMGIPVRGTAGNLQARLGNLEDSGSGHTWVDLYP